MADILIAYSSGTNERRWRELRDAISSDQESFVVVVRAATWRTQEDVFPQVRRGDLVYVVYNRLVRGQAPIKQVLGRDDMSFWLELDLNRWESHGLEWPYGPKFGHSWRYARFSPACYTDFNNWGEHPGLPIGQPRTPRVRAGAA
jgi:hypothetical protein